MTYNFTDRASYIISIKEWAKKYHELSAQIRTARNELKEVFRRNAYIGDIWKAIANLKGLQQQAREEINWRHGSKKEAKRQYLSSKNVLPQ